MSLEPLHSVIGSQSLALCTSDVPAAGAGTCWWRGGAIPSRAGGLSQPGRACHGSGIQRPDPHGARDWTGAIWRATEHEYKRACRFTAIARGSDLERQPAMAEVPVQNDAPVISGVRFGE